MCQFKHFSHISIIIIEKTYKHNANNALLEA